MNNQQDYSLSPLIPIGFLFAFIYNLWGKLDSIDKFLIVVVTILLLLICGYIFYEYFSKQAKEKRKTLKEFNESPQELREANSHSVLLGYDYNTKLPIYLPNRIRTQHVHIVGSTGSGKTKSVILSFLKQDIKNGNGAIILDAKGDNDFLDELKKITSNLSIFDLGSEVSDKYNPLSQGLFYESAQRLLSSLTWSEEYYKVKAFEALQKIFEVFFIQFKRNPTLIEINNYLSLPDKYTGLVSNIKVPKKQAESDYADLSGLIGQLQILNLGSLGKNLSPLNEPQIDLNDVRNGKVIYFRLQSLMSPQLASVMGKLVINNLNYLAGNSHRNDNLKTFVPIYLDEFATFACPEFADLISKARSAGFALHFSHQSLGDLKELSDNFLSKLSDNSATRIVLRINDPDSAEYFARCFGTKEYQKLTQRVTNSKEVDSAQSVGEGTIRDAHQFKMGPSEFKSLPTGIGNVLIAHGRDALQGASSVFKVRFPILK